MRRARPGFGWLKLGGVILACAAAAPAHPHSARVTQAGGSARVFELRLDDPALAPATDAYVAVGREQGLRAETAVALSFALDPGRLTARPGAATHSFEFLRLTQDPAARAARLVLFVSLSPAGEWWLGAWSWDDGAARFTLAGLAPLARAGASDVPAAVRVTVEWRAAAGRERGSLRLWRDDPPGAPTLMFEHTDLGNASQTLDTLVLGVRAGDPAPGVVGVLGIDDLELQRLIAAGR